MVKKIQFEASIKRLEEIVEIMENKDPDLNKSLELFEEGIKLVNLCTSKLEDAKKKVEILVRKGNKIVAEPFSEVQEIDGNDVG